MATIDQVQARFKHGPNGGAVITRGGSGEEANSAYAKSGESWDAGAWLVRDSNGEITELGTGVPSKILGQALESESSATAGDPVFYRPLVPGSVLIMNVHHDTAASAVTARNQMDAPHFNFSYDSGKLGLDIETAVDTGKPMGRIIRFLDTLGDQYGRVEVQVIDNVALQA
jgi:hypothetical protein